MKARHALISIITGYCLDFLAGWLKIVHYSGVDICLIAGAVLKIAGLILLTFKVIHHPAMKDFWNR